MGSVGNNKSLGPTGGEGPTKLNNTDIYYKRTDKYLIPFEHTRANVRTGNVEEIKNADRRYLYKARIKDKGSSWHYDYMVFIPLKDGTVAEVHGRTLAEVRQQVRKLNTPYDYGYGN